SNLPWEVTAHELGELFSQYGKVNQTTIVTHRNGRSRGFGFVNMHALAAPKAIDGLHGAHLNGRPLTVRPARQVA
ncbi:MAG: RNA-binding protein, partial [Actinomycetota bacterium]|nr:RNA-binding protein [Actinomycetota bacterium]